MSLKDELLKKQLDAKPGDDACMVVTSRPGEVAFMEFYLSPHNCCAYAPSQLLHYQLYSKKPDVGDDPTKPAQTLRLGFATVDVVITGNRLQLVTAALKEGTLAVLRTMPERYSELKRNLPFVASIDIKRVEQGDEESSET